jgi:hypothetical protein
LMRGTYEVPKPVECSVPIENAFTCRTIADAFSRLN